jgi:hypothetical protein
MLQNSSYLFLQVFNFNVQNTHQNEQQKMLKLSYKQRNIIIKVNKNW